ncbi:MAG: S41 family peptidase [Bacteroidaceae bacterium]|nr:S41 family peptidase [Bacteroidaceae bacterium]
MKNKLLPLCVAVGVVVGIIFGNFYANHLSQGKVGIYTQSDNKINNLLSLIDANYVDNIDMTELVEKSLPKILQELDPHSTYIPAEKVELSMQNLKKSFSGIGVRFMILRDTVCVVHVIDKGPSQRAGILAGERIVAVDNKPYVGKVVNNDTTMKLLKGQKNTEVTLTLYNPTTAKQRKVVVQRDDVPLSSVDAAYIIEPSVGYMRINAFAENTYEEFWRVIHELEKEGMKSLLIDLRGNTGGYMDPAIKIANEFLGKNKLIVYTKGQKSGQYQEYKSDGRGLYQDLPLVILVDETSASASEILAGAMQDHDRATIVGRRTFGKGLVQKPISFSDNSIVRLTTARYYTPSGRCLQKPYTPGDEQEYEKELVLREISGEYYSPDSIYHTEEKFKTMGGRIVYGGGGIIPEIFTPRDTTAYTQYLREAVMRGLVGRFSFEYVDKHRTQFNLYKNSSQLLQYLQGQPLVNLFTTYAAHDSLPLNAAEVAKSRSLLQQFIISSIVVDLFDTEDQVRYVNTNDPALERALDVIRQGKAFPLSQQGEKKLTAAWSGVQPRFLTTSAHFMAVWSPWNYEMPTFYSPAWCLPLATHYIPSRWRNQTCVNTYVS